MINQCDGCIAHHPLKRVRFNGKTSFHHEVRMPTGYRNGMVCQASKYGCKPFQNLPSFSRSRK